MEDYVSLPSQQLANLVKRYVQFRRATEIEGECRAAGGENAFRALQDRIQTEAIDNETREMLERMEALYERVRFD